jgi:hypothetical protein
MSNRLLNNPIYLDTFSADITVHATPISVIRIDLLSATAGEIFVLEDSDGNHIIQILQNGSGRITSWTPSEPVRFDKGLYFDYDDVNSGLAAGDKVWIYYK